MIKITQIILIILTASLTNFSCQSYFERKIVGVWDIKYAMEDDISTRYEFALNAISIGRHQYKVVDTIALGHIPTRFDDNCQDSNLYGFTVFEKKSKHYLSLLVSDCNSFFRDTFEIIQLDEKQLWIKSRNKEMICERMPW